MSSAALQGPQEKQRLAYVDIAKTLALFIVILFHKQGILQTILQRFGASFHMPIFFFLYGMTTSGGATLEKPWCGVMRRFRSLMVPYFLWSLIYVRTWSLALKDIPLFFVCK